MTYSHLSGKLSDTGPDSPHNASPLPMSRRKRLVLNIYIILLTLLTTSAFYYFFAKPPTDSEVTQGSGGDSKIYVLLWLLFYGLTLLLFLQTIAKQGFKPGFTTIVLLGAFTIGSFTWSFDMKRTLFYSIMLMTLPLAAYIVVQNVSPRRFLRITTLVFIFLLITSLLLLMFFPQISSSTRYGGGWLTSSEMNGVFAHKSDAGYYFACTTIMLMGAGASRLPFLGWKRLLLIGLAITGIILANSATALVATLFLSSLTLATKISSKDKIILYILIGFTLFLFAISTPYLPIGAFAELLGRDPNLTGRDPIWRLGTQFIGEHPLIGYGYYGFFGKDAFSPLWKLWAQFDYFLTPHFHNSAMDVLISLGFAGFLFYIFIVSIAILLIQNRTIPIDIRTVLTSILFIFIITTSFDFTFFKHNHYATFFLFYCFFAAQKSFSQRPERGSAAAAAAG